MEHSLAGDLVAAFAEFFPGAAEIGSYVGGKLIPGTADLIQLYDPATFGTLYGICFCGYGFGAVIGPVALGKYFDVHGNYELPLVLLPCLSLCACLLTLTLGRYRRSGERNAEVASYFTEA